MKQKKYIEYFKKSIKYYKSLTIGKQTLFYFLLYIISGILFNPNFIKEDFSIMDIIGFSLITIFGLLFFLNLIVLIFQYLKKVYKSKHRYLLILLFFPIIFLVYKYNFSDEAKENEIRKKAEHIVKYELESLNNKIDYLSSDKEKNRLKYCRIKGSKLDANRDIEVYFDCLYDKGYYLMNGITFDLMSSHIQDKKK
jgi:hypothetical protein